MGETGPLGETGRLLQSAVLRPVGFASAASLMDGQRDERHSAAHADDDGVQYDQPQWIHFCSSSLRVVEELLCTSRVGPALNRGAEFLPASAANRPPLGVTHAVKELADAIEAAFAVDLGDLLR